MDRSEKQLDEIEIDLQRLPDNALYKNELMDEYKKLREEFENNPNVDVNFDFRVRDLSMRVENYLEGKTKNPMIDKKEAPPVLQTLDNMGEKETIQYTRDKIQIDILCEYAEKVDFESSPENVLAAIRLITQKYEGIEMYSRELEQKIAGLKYRMMIKYLELRNLEEAKEYSKTFDTDMRIYIVDRLKGKIQGLIDKGALEEAERINAYVYSDEISTDNLELWEAIVRVETLGWNYRLKEEEKTSESNLPAIPEKKGVFSRIVNNLFSEKQKEERAKRKAIREEEKAKGLKILIIKYDPKNAPGFIDIESLKEFYIWVEKTRGKKCKVVFEEGIKIIDFPKIGIGKYTGYSEKIEITVGKESYYYPKYAYDIVEVDIPTTAERIEPYTFRNVKSLKSIDLSKSKIKEIGESAFEYCGKLQQVFIPKTLERMGQSAFKDTAVECLDLSETQLKEISEEAFAYCKKMKKITLPRTLEVIGKGSFFETGLEELNASYTNLITIGESAFWHSANFKSISLPNCFEKMGPKIFFGTRIEKLDFSKTQVKSIPAGMAESCTHLKSVIFPSNLELILDNAFYGSGIKKIDLRNTGVYAIKNRAFADCKELRLFSGALTLQTMENDAFEYTQLDHVVKNMIKDGIKLTDKQITPTSYRELEKADGEKDTSAVESKNNRKKENIDNNNFGFDEV